MFMRLISALHSVSEVYYFAHIVLITYWNWTVGKQMEAVL